jgi:lipopolysaccharide transport system permease protein
MPELYVCCTIRNLMSSFASTSPVRPRLVIQPTRGWAALNLADLWHFRDLLLTLAKRDVKLRYRQTALGVSWVIIQPLLAAGVFSFVFGKVAGMKSGGTPYIVFSYAGLLAWNLFSGILTRSSGCLVQNSQLISKVYFPRLVLPISTVFSALIDFAVALGLMAVLMAIYHVHPGIGLLLAPVCLLAFVLLALGVGLYFAALSTSYRDVQYVLPFLTQIVLYASPVAYMTDKVPARYQAIFLLNPLASLLEGFRWAVIADGTVHWRYFAYSLVFSAIVFVWGVVAFKRMERRFADVI